jgi:hypothetical protein
MVVEKAGLRNRAQREQAKLFDAAEKRVGKKVGRSIA